MTTKKRFLSVGLVTLLSLSLPLAADPHARDPRTVPTQSDDKEVPKCESAGEPLPQEPGYTLAISQSWGQQLIGGDLALKVILAEKEREKVSVALRDEGFTAPLMTGLAKDHQKEILEQNPVKAGSADGKRLGAWGTGNANLINGVHRSGRRFGIGPDAQFVLLSDRRFHSDEMQSKFPEKVAERKAKILSFGFPPYIALDRKAAEAAPIAVVPIGNDFPAKVPQWLTTFGGITVGDLNLIGGQSATSPETGSWQPTIWAPGGKWLHTVDGLDSASKNELQFAKENPHLRRKVELFPRAAKDAPFSSVTGNAGAAALVTGALVSVLSLVPDLTQEEAKAWLQGTAVTLADGKPMLNALKLVELAVRMRRIGKAERLAALRSRRLKGKEIFDFKAEADEAVKQAETMAKTKGCEREELGWLRRAWLLDPTRADIRDKIAKAIEASPHKMDANFYRMLDPKQRTKIVEEHLQFLPEFAIPAGRLLGSLPAEDRLRIATRELDSDVKMSFLAAKALKDMKEEGLPVLRAAAKKGNVAAALMLGDEGKDTVINSFTSGNPIKTLELLRGIGDEAVPYLIAATKESTLGEEVLGAARRLGPQGFPVVKALIEGSNTVFTVKSQAVRLLLDYGEEGEKLLAKVLDGEGTTYGDAVVQTAAVENVTRLDPAKAAEILKPRFAAVMARISPAYWDLKQQILRSLTQMKGEGLPFAVEMMADPDDKVKDAAIDAVFQIAKADREPAMKLFQDKIAKTDNPMIQQIALRAHRLGADGVTLIGAMLEPRVWARLNRSSKNDIVAGLSSFQANGIPIKSLGAPLKEFLEEELEYLEDRKKPTDAVRKLLKELEAK